ncbi:MAG: DUF6194 family protein [Solirubrobacteraceae bacterium]|nr:DUF6194 family protein [Patulibacter sp.]
MDSLTTLDEIVEAARALPGTLVDAAGPSTGAPEAVWGDVFLSFDPTGELPAERRFPFATVVRSDSDGAASILDRPDVFRFNVGVGRVRFEELLGFAPSANGDRAAAFNYTVLDQLLPHPWYASQAWVCVLNPGVRTAELAAALLVEAHGREAARHAALHPGGSLG